MQRIQNAENAKKNIIAREHRLQRAQGMQKCKKWK